MAVIALVLLIWLCLNVALVFFRWIYLDRSDELPRHALSLVQGGRLESSLQASEKTQGAAHRTQRSVLAMPNHT
jgi:hypothetical protein